MPIKIFHTADLHRYEIQWLSDLSKKSRSRGQVRGIAENGAKS